MRVRKRVARWIGTVAIIGASLLPLAVLFAWSGVYSVAASQGHWAVTEWFLAFVMRNSVENRALLVESPASPEDPDLITLGAAHFRVGCAACHGAPGVTPSPIARGMLPAPPDLSASATQWSEAELFWIVQHGIKYTGMPSWPSADREDEVWAVVAFLRKLPDLDAAAYGKLALGALSQTRRDGWQIVLAGSEEAASACGRCHGMDERGPLSGRVPVLHSQPVEYLVASLEAYANGMRQSGFMQPIVAELTSQEMRELAAYYAGLERPATTVDSADKSAVERGRIIALAGVPASEVPPCTSCHTSQARAEYPRLAGQGAAYLAAQLRLWKRGVNSKTPASQIMAPIARRLTDGQVDDIAAFYSQLAESLDGAEAP